MSTNEAQDWGEPWTVAKQPVYLGKRTLKHALMSRHGSTVSAAGIKLKEQNERLAALMNLFQSIPTSTIEQACKQRTELTTLLLSCFLNPNDVTALMMLKDELDEILNSVKEETGYVPREKIVEMLIRVVKYTKHTSMIGDNSEIYRDIVNLIGVRCEATWSDSKTTYYCTNGWHLTEPEHRQCFHCKGTGKVLPSGIRAHGTMIGGPVEPEKEEKSVHIPHDIGGSD